MDFPLIPKAEALALLGEAYDAAEARGEFLAEQGSSYFHGGMTASDATFSASMDFAQREEDFHASEEGERYFARLDAAKLWDGLVSDLNMYAEHDGWIPWGNSHVVPEFYPGQPVRKRHAPTPDDIPF